MKYRSYTTSFNIVGVLAMFSLFIGSIVGWVWNIIKLTELLDGGSLNWIIARAVGVVFGPFGAILGYF